MTKGKICGAAKAKTTTEYGSEINFIAYINAEAAIYLQNTNLRLSGQLQCSPFLFLGASLQIRQNS